MSDDADLVAEILSAVAERVDAKHPELWPALIGLDTSAAVAEHVVRALCDAVVERLCAGRDIRARHLRRLGLPVSDGVPDDARLQNLDAGAEHFRAGYYPW